VAGTDEQLHAERVRGVKWRPIAEVFAAARGVPPTKLAIRRLVDELKQRYLRWRGKRHAPKRVARRTTMEELFFEDDE
jgi:hypothetical protein